MKKYIYFFSITLLATLSFTLMSCGDDDENNETMVTPLKLMV